MSEGEEKREEEERIKNSSILRHLIGNFGD
jgi:hypothetical protein